MGSRQQSLVPRFNQTVQRLHNWRGSGSPAPDISPEIGHVIVLRNDRVEDLLLAGERPWADRCTLAAQGAGIFGYVQYENPAASGTLLIIERFKPDISGNVFLIGLTNTQAAVGTGAIQISNNAVSSRDSRLYAVNLNANKRLFSNTQGLFVDGRVQGSITGSTVFADWVNDMMFVVHPGFSFRITVTGANQAIDGTVWGRERNLEQGELQQG